MIGTLINFSTVIVGGTLGLAISGRLPERIKVIVVAAIGLMTIVLGVSAAIQTENALIPLVALVIGAISGELLDIDKGVNHLGNWLKQRFDKAGDGQNFTTAFVIASLQFCVGPLTNCFILLSH